MFNAYTIRDSVTNELLATMLAPVGEGLGKARDWAALVDPEDPSLMYAVEVHVLSRLGASSPRLELELAD